VGPGTAGSRHFERGAGLSVYIHRVPCIHGAKGSLSRPEARRGRRKSSGQ
jgi:hypothetical protein